MRQRRINLRGLVSPLAVGLLWELLVALGVLNANYLPPPSQLAPHLVALLAGGELWRHLLMTLYRLCLSFAFALVPAQNATGNWIKVVQRLPVRVTLDPKELRKHPLRVGLSMEVDVDVSN